MSFGSRDAQQVDVVHRDAGAPRAHLRRRSVRLHQLHQGRRAAALEAVESVDKDKSTSSSTNAATPASIDGEWTVKSGSTGRLPVPRRSSSVRAPRPPAGPPASPATMTIDRHVGRRRDLHRRPHQVKSDSDNRDNQFQGRIMNTAEFPNATFKLTEPIELGERAGRPEAGHRRRRPVTSPSTARRSRSRSTISARRNGDAIETNGSDPDHLVRVRHPCAERRPGRGRGHRRDGVPHHLRPPPPDPLQFWRQLHAYTVPRRRNGSGQAGARRRRTSAAGWSGVRARWILTSIATTPSGRTTTGLQSSSRTSGISSASRPTRSSRSSSAATSAGARAAVAEQQRRRPQRRGRGRPRRGR